MAELLTLFDRYAGILHEIASQDERWQKLMPDVLSQDGVYVWALKAQEELGELSAALLGQLIGKKGRGDALQECRQLIGVLLRIEWELRPAGDSGEQTSIGNCPLCPQDERRLIPPCPICGCSKYQAGPSAGLSQNIRCENGHCWNRTPFGFDPIGEDKREVPGCTCQLVRQ